MEYYCGFLTIIIIWLWVMYAKRAEKLKDSTKLLRESAAMIEDLAGQIAARDDLIARNEHMRKYYEGHTESLKRQLEEKEQLLVEKEKKITFLEGYTKYQRGKVKDSEDRLRRLTDLLCQQGIDPDKN